MHALHQDNVKYNRLGEKKNAAIQTASNFKIDQSW